MANIGNSLQRGLFIAASVAIIVLLRLPISAQDAAGLYKAKCSMCHGAEGKGDTPIGKKLGAHDFTSSDVQKMSDDELAAVIADGKNKMPGYKKSLKPDQIKDLVAYIRGMHEK